MLRIACIGLAAAVAGCASGVGEPIPYGQEKYGLNAQMGPFSGGSEGALRAAIQSAKAFCNNQGKEANITHTADHGAGQVSINFRCQPIP